MAPVTIPDRPADTGLDAPPRPAARTRWWLEALLIAWLAWVYDAINDLTPLRRVLPYRHADSVLKIERLTHLNPEEWLNHWMAGHQVIGWVTGTFYDTAHYIVTFTLVGVLWYRRPDIYRPLRTSLALTNVFGFLVFLTYPMAPPRLTPTGHFVDVVAQSHAFLSWHTGTLATAANEVAAMPSLHMSWALWSAIAFWQMFRRHWWSHLAWLHPVLTAFAVLGTGNHFLADVIAGLAVLGVSGALSWWWYTYRPVPLPRWFSREPGSPSDAAELADATQPQAVSSG